VVDLHLARTSSRHDTVREPTRYKSRTTTSLSSHVEPLKRSRQVKITNQGCFRSYYSSTTGKISSTEATPPHRHPAGSHRNVGHADWMGTNARLLFQVPAMAVVGAATPYADGGWLSISVVNALLTLDDGTTTDLRVGWTSR